MKNPTNTTEFAKNNSSNTDTDYVEKSVEECLSKLSISQIEPVRNPEIDIQKFKQSLAHKHGPDCDHDNIPPLTWKDVKSLKKSRYFEIKDKYKIAYVLQNKRTKQIAEIQAASSIQACNIIGWKPNRTKIIDTINVEKRDAEIAEKSKKITEKIETKVDAEGSSGSSG